jgi:hypothetical protein
LHAAAGSPHLALFREIGDREGEAEALNGLAGARYHWPAG